MTLRGSVYIDGNLLGSFFVNYHIRVIILAGVKYEKNIGNYSSL